MPVRQTQPNTMRAAAINRFGGPETITLRTLPVPEVGPDEVLIRVQTAGVGEFAAVGEQVKGFKEGDRVYAAGFLNPKDGFYAEYAVVNADLKHTLLSTTTTSASSPCG